LYLNEKGFELIFPTRLSKFRKMTYVFSRAMIASTHILEMSFTILDRVEVYERAGARSGHTVRFYTDDGDTSHVTVEMSTAKVMILLQHLKGKTSVEVCSSLQSYFSRIE
jgi:hypothetical protein